MLRPVAADCLLGPWPSRRRSRPLGTTASAPNGGIGGAAGDGGLHGATKVMSVWEGSGPAFQVAANRDFIFLSMSSRSEEERRLGGMCVRVQRGRHFPVV